ncbi:MAG: tetratricopeptide repeat protein [Deltaproteobacteria bacterium]|nr:tetratricopeptide repeat protein [Deltaproteobacteria bacterium]
MEKKDVPELETAWRAFRSGEKDAAASIAHHRDTRRVCNAELHLAWADLLEELGMIPEAVEELNLAVRDDPDGEAAVHRLSEIYLDQNRPDKAAQLWERLVQRHPENPEYRLKFGRALLEAREYPRAREVLEQAHKETADPRISAHLRELHFLEDEKGSENTPEPTDAHPMAPTQNQLVVFTSLFSGREGVHARQWLSPSGEAGYTPVQEPFTPKVAENHILGNITVGIYPVRLDNTVNFIAFDLDLAKFAVRAAITKKRAWDDAMNRVHQAACRLIEAASEYDLPLTLEDSGFKGRHAWMFLEEPVPAGVAKKLGDLLAGLILPLPAEVQVEVFPKQGSVPRESLGNLIKLPLGIHRRTGKRGMFVTPENIVIQDPLGFLEAAQRVPRRTVYSLVQKLQSRKVISFPGKGKPEPAKPAKPFETESEKESAPLPPVPEAFDLDRDLEFQTLMLKCPVIKALVEKIHQTYRIEKDEAMVLIHTVGHLDHGPEIINELFERCAHADPTYFLKSRLKGNPMSCPKIRLRVPSVTSRVACNCTFDPDAHLYPTPVIHARAAVAAAGAGPMALTVDSVQFQNLVQDYLKLRKQLRELTVLMGKYENRIKSVFDDAGVEFIKTPLGNLKKVVTDDGAVAFSLEL